MCNYRLQLLSSINQSAYSVFDWEMSSQSISDWVGIKNDLIPEFPMRQKMTSMLNITYSR